jgi:copper(I)-binding protein
MNGWRLGVGLAALLAASGAVASAPACAPVVEQGWIRAAPPRAGVLAAYARLRDPCNRAGVVTAARSADFGRVQLHETRVAGGVSTMREATRLALPARGELRFAPGGAHLMLMQPRRPLPVGARVHIAFALADGRVVDGVFVVRRDAP